MYDLKITGGMIYDGSGGAPFKGGIAIKDGLIVAVGHTVDGDAMSTLDATGHIITPGFIDLHTHYDGQLSWDEELKPSVNHGVTTAVTGNCGVGFAPCRREDRAKLISLMEGVEDMPGTVLHEGLTWDWESFPEFMDALDTIPHAIDFAVMVPHDPLRVFAMGDRAVFDEAATQDDVAKMADIMREALEAGAIGFSTGRSDVHKTADGDWTPSSEAGRDELVGIASVFQNFDYGVLQAVNDFDMVRPEDNFDAEFDLMAAFFKAGKKPGSMSLMQRDFAPDDWQKIISRSEKLNSEGLDISFQVAPRAIGVFLGLNSTFHPLMAYPSYINIADKPLEEKVAILKDPAYKTQLLSETPVQLSGPGSSIPPLTDIMIAQFADLANKIFKLEKNGSVDYEQGQSDSIVALAKRDKQTLLEKTYDLLLEEDGHALLYYPVYNYTEMNYDNVLTMMSHDKALPGLSDGGAHVGFICDASFPTYLLSHWTRDRPKRGQEGIALTKAVNMLTAKGADYLGLSDRGRLVVGQKADINIIDYEALALGVPEMVKDLPAGGQRLLQPVTGYKATFVSGQQVIANDEVTDARPGRLVRAGSARS